MGCNKSSALKGNPIESDKTNLLLWAREAAVLEYINIHSTMPVRKVSAYREG